MENRLVEKESIPLVVRGSPEDWAKLDGLRTELAQGFERCF